MEANDLCELIQLRWQELENKGMTTYQLAKEYARLKGDPPEDKRYNRYVSTIQNAIENPMVAKTGTLEIIKQILGIETRYAIIERREISLNRK